MFGINTKLQFMFFQRNWKKHNRNNYTVPTGEVFDISRVNVGNNTYGKLNIKNYGSDSHIKIGNYCSIGDDTVFLASLEHNTKNISTYPFKVYFLNEVSEMMSKGDIIVDDDVWIGYGATILSGVHIGQGAVVAAGAVVTKDVPPYAIVGGIPAKVIKYRFELELIDELLKVDYSKLTPDMVKTHIDNLYIELKEKCQLDWMPKKN